MRKAEKAKEISENKKMTEHDELLIGQLRPYASGSILCCLLALFCLWGIGFQITEAAFWLCIATLIINAVFLVFSIRKTFKIRKLK